MLARTEHGLHHCDGGIETEPELVLCACVEPTALQIGAGSFAAVAKQRGPAKGADRLQCATARVTLGVTLCLFPRDLTLRERDPG